MSVTRITLYLPGLVGPLAGVSQLKRQDWPALPALERLLAAARREPTPVDEVERGLFALFHVDVAPDTELPIAQFSFYADTGQAPEFHYWRADPVHIAIDRERALLLEHGMLEIGDAEAKQLVVTLARHLREEGIHLQRATNHHWYLRFDQTVDLITTPLRLALHRDIGECLPTGKDAKRWATWLNELQMLLHNHPVNEQRLDRGAYPINSLWLWGGGKTTQQPRSDYDHIWSDDTVVNGLAAVAGTPQSALPIPIDLYALQSTLQGGHGLIVQPNLFAAVNDGDVFEWLSLLQWLEDKYFQPLLGALESRQLSEVCLLPCDGQRWRIAPGALKKWWRRPKPLAHWLVGR
jgi:hypothetical protein